MKYLIVHGAVIRRRKYSEVAPREINHSESAHKIHGDSDRILRRCLEVRNEPSNATLSGNLVTNEVIVARERQVITGLMACSRGLVYF